LILTVGWARIVDDGVGVAHDPGSECQAPAVRRPAGGQYSVGDVRQPGCVPTVGSHREELVSSSQLAQDRDTATIRRPLRSVIALDAGSQPARRRTRAGPGTSHATDAP